MKLTCDVCGCSFHVAKLDDLRGQWRHPLLESCIRALRERMDLLLIAR